MVRLEIAAAHSISETMTRLSVIALGDPAETPKEPAAQKHPYIPVFYLKQWAGPDGRLCEFRRPYKEVKPRMTHPDGTGYVRGLYTFGDLPPGTADFLEQRFLLRADDRAYAALCLLLADNVDFDNDTKSAWSRFLMTLFHRNPERIAHLKTSLTTNLPAELEKYRPTYEARGFSAALNFEDFLRYVVGGRFAGHQSTGIAQIDGQRVGGQRTEPHVLGRDDERGVSPSFPHIRSANHYVERTETT